MRLRVGQVGVLLDDLGDCFGGVLRHLVDSLADGGLVDQVRLEDQAEGGSVTTNELEVGADAGCDPLLVLSGGGQSRPDQIQQLTGVLVEQRQVEIELAGEVLV